MKKFMMTLAAVLCCAMTTAVFTACGDDDVETLPVAGPYKYSVEFVSSQSTNIVDSEAAALKVALNKAVGLEGNIWKKTYTSNKDAEMKAACEEVLKQYSNVQSLLLTYALYRHHDNESQPVIVTSDLKAGRCIKDPKEVLLVTYKTEGATEFMKSDKAKADTAWANALKKETLAFRNSLHAVINEAIKDYVKVWVPANSLEKVYNKAYFDEITAEIVRQKPDTLAYTIIINIYKENIPELTNTTIWERTFEANYK